MRNGLLWLGASGLRRLLTAAPWVRVEAGVLWWPSEGPTPVAGHVDGSQITGHPGPPCCPAGLSCVTGDAFLLSPRSLDNSDGDVAVVSAKRRTQGTGLGRGGVRAPGTRTADLTGCRSGLGSLTGLWGALPGRPQRASRRLLSGPCSVHALPAAQAAGLRLSLQGPRSLQLLLEPCGLTCSVALRRHCPRQGQGRCGGPHVSAFRAAARL